VAEKDFDRLCCGKRLDLPGSVGIRRADTYDGDDCGVAWGEVLGLKPELREVGVGVAGFEQVMGRLLE